MSRPSYKKLYEQEKARRKAYERLYPDVAEKYEIAHAAALRLYQDIERAVLFGGTDEKPRIMMGLTSIIHQNAPQTPSESNGCGGNGDDRVAREEVA